MADRAPGRHLVGRRHEHTRTLRKAMARLPLVAILRGVDAARGAGDRPARWSMKASR